MESKTNKKISYIQRTDWRLPEVGCRRVDKMGGGDQHVQTFSYKVRKFPGGSDGKEILPAMFVCVRLILYH